jgi:hypothetical protein
MHSLAVLVVPNDPVRANMRPLVARDAALSARIETLLFRYEQPEEMAWGVDHSRGFIFDWYAIGGRWEGWGRRVRQLMVKQKVQPSRRPIPRSLERNAVWSEDVGRVRISSLAEYPLAVITPHGDWVDCPGVLPIFGKPTARQRNAKAAWLRKIQRIMKAYPDCLAVAIDYHY